MKLIDYWKCSKGHWAILRALNILTTDSFLFVMMVGCVALVHIYPYPVYAILTMIYVWTTYQTGCGTLLDYYNWRNNKDEDS